ncbi:MAG: Fic family protein [Ignavibacteria bacterium]|jgi:Fic family protein
MSKDSGLNKLDIINKIDSVKKEIDNLKPIKPEIKNRILQKFRLDWNYNSNAIEGNSLTFGETQAFLMHDITAKGKPFKDYLDIKGHNEAIDYLLNFVHNKEELTEAFIRELHKIILVEPYEIDALTPDNKPTKRKVSIGAYKKQPNHVKTKTREIHYFATPEETPAKMEELVKWYRKSRDEKELHPLIIASIFHHRITAIHPFDDGNGRIARLLMNLILMQYQYPPVVITQNKKENYYAALSQADSGEYLPFVELIGEYLLYSLNLYLKGAKGENIEELDDLDKEIALLKKEIETEYNSLDNYKSSENMTNVLQKSFIPLLVEIEKTMDKFSDLFVEKNFAVSLIDKHNGINSLFRNKKSIKIDQVKNTQIKNNLITKVILLISLNELKSEKNILEINLPLILEFDKYEYSIYYFIATSPFAFQDLWDSKGNILSYNPYLTNKYSSTITKEEITSIGKEIGKLIITYIKEKAK